MPAKHGRTLENMAQRKKLFTEEHEGHDSARMKCPQQANPYRQTADRGLQIHTDRRQTGDCGAGGREAGANRSQAEFVSCELVCRMNTSQNSAIREGNPLVPSFNSHSC